MQKYFPILKTTDAELKAYEYLSKYAKSVLRPIFELTKSRKTKMSPFGDVSKRMDQIGELLENRSFILDVTSHEDMMNYQIQEFLDSSNGFSNWRNFLGNYPDLNVIPSAHFDLSDLDQTTNLANELLKKRPFIACRLDLTGQEESPSFDEIIDCIKAMRASDSTLSKSILILDAGFVDLGSFPRKYEIASAVINHLLQYKPQDVVITSSSFPETKKLIGYTSTCGQDSGYFTCLEEKFSEDLSRILKTVSHGDYASLHPFRYPTITKGFVPRIDVFRNDRLFFYERRRREAGGYPKVAAAIKSNDYYQRLDCWGHEQIDLASANYPVGLSPAYWVAVRANIYMSVIAQKLMFM